MLRIIIIALYSPLGLFLFLFSLLTTIRVRVRVQHTPNFPFLSLRFAKGTLTESASSTTRSLQQNVGQGTENRHGTLTASEEISFQRGPSQHERGPIERKKTMKRRLIPAFVLMFWTYDSLGGHAAWCRPALLLHPSRWLLLLLLLLHNGIRLHHPCVPRSSSSETSLLLFLHRRWRCQTHVGSHVQSCTH